MPKSKISAISNPTDLLPEEADVPSQTEDSTGSEQKSDSEVSFHRSQPYAVPEAIPNMYMSYIEGPKWIGLLTMGCTIGSLCGD